MRREKLDVQEALRWGSALPYGWICTLSGVSLGPVPGELPLEELVEARLFGPTEEVRLFRREGELQAAVFAEEPGDQVLAETYTIQNKALFGNELTVHQILDADEDGQCYIAAVRLADWKGGAEHGGK